MLNLKKKVKELQENTASLEARAVCKEFLENFANLTDSQIASTLVEKLKTVEDSDKHVAKFIQVAEKITSLNDLGVAKSIAALKESQIYAYPGLRYGLEKIESSLTYKQVRIVEEESKSKDFKPGDTWTALKLGNTSNFRLQESNIAGKPEFMMIDNLLETLKNFSWDKEVENIYSDLKKKRSDLSESIDIAISMYNMAGNKGSFFFDPILPKLEEHLLNPTESSRSSIIEELRKLNFYPAAKSLSESLSRIQQNATKGVQVISDNTKCTVSSIYSPVLLENGGEYFFSRGNYFNKHEGKITKVNEESLTSLPEKFVNVCRIISSPNVFIKEGKISFYLKRDKVEILENEKKVEIRFNGSKIEGGELAKRMVSAGLFRLEESKIAYDVQSLAESFENIFDLDFGKIIESKVYPGSYVILMKDGDKIYLNKTNESIRSNEFFSDLNATQARNLIMEFIGFDIKESMEEYLEKDETKLKELREAQSNIIQNLSIVEANLNKVNTTLGDAFMSSNPELHNLKSVLEEELTKLKSQHRNLAQQIKSFESKTTSDAGYDVGEEVKLTETGDSATITAVNSSRETVTVVTAKGKTVEVPVSKISSTEADTKKAEAKNEGEDEDKKKA